MHSSSKLEGFVLCSGYVGLECECGERLVLIGREEDWRLERRAAFECECGRKLTLDDNRIELPAGLST